MKKIILSFLLLLTIPFLSWCSIDWNNEKDQKIVKLEKQVEELKKEKENDLFKKKQECLQYKNDILKDLKEKELKANKWVYVLEQLFYSPKRNWCYFVSITENWNSTEKWLYEYWNHSWYSDSVYSCNYYYDETFTKKDNWCEELNNKIKELKWE